MNDLVDDYDDDTTTQTLILDLIQGRLQKEKTKFPITT